MFSHLRWLAASVVLLAHCAPVGADVCIGLRARREIVGQHLENQARTCDFEIVRDAGITEAELRIPRRLILADASSGGSSRTAMAGLALSAAFVGGGLWCLRFHGSRVPTTKWIGAGLLAVLFAGTLMMGSLADATPPSRGPGLLQTTVKIGEVDVKVQIVEQGDVVQLVVPPELADKIAAR